MLTRADGSPDHVINISITKALKSETLLLAVISLRDRLCVINQKNTDKILKHPHSLACMHMVEHYTLSLTYVSNKFK